ncbi:P-loop containing nucleoside triphosphate hydrolase protein [Lepidopterella palustris CBS 459.81]|uniref:P-loop containing nucleoside triphosphate hydrolase protein n=1 Tax=Lepidopterella palustris CBS 459.81 TaxID=1314670 RepID=A0A8E2E956_9PEZI|nr:P-loop containing nucleoside triphosphate hydrolase protein [Lepidopterella palustris CBS 459.81]
MVQTALYITVSPQAKLSYLALASIVSRRSFLTSTKQASSGQYHRSDFSGQGFTGIYEPDQPTGGPLGGASIVGAPRITPKALKQHLDQFVVGQGRAKKVLSVAVYNHYQRIQELQRRDDEQAELEAKAARRELGYRHPVEDEFPGQKSTMNVYPPSSEPPSPQQSTPETPKIFDYTPLTIEKSNVLLLGPSGVGKTLMAKTLARVLDVPFSMSDCTPFTQAGYIGEDAEVCVQRLLASANYDVTAAERGIICLDEIDKIATAKVAHGKDVSGEGVQQALLKIIEGTTLQIQSKQDRGGSGRSPSSVPGSGVGFPSSSPLNSGGGGGGGGGGGMNPNPPGGKGEVFNVRTDNILFIFTGAFIGLHKMILDRISKGSIGFGAPVRASNPNSGPHDTMLKGEDALFKKHLPFFIPDTPAVDTQAQPSSQTQMNLYNTLDLVEPADLQKYGMIPELVGRIPISCALSALDEEALVRVLTEPRNSLLCQYEQLFQLSGVELRFTSGALREVAKGASRMGTGARGLRTVLERLLGESMFEIPGSPIKYILITQLVAQLKQPPIYLTRGQQHKFHALIAAEEEAWEAQKENEENPHVQAHSFEEYRIKSQAAGVM